VPCGWVASYFGPLATHERAPQIQVGDVVRVLRGPRLVQQGLIVARSEHGAALYLTDLETNENVGCKFDVDILILTYLYLFTVYC
jgi:hypothetical protein